MGGGAAPARQLTGRALADHGARVALLLEPGLFRLDVTGEEDTLTPRIRLLGPWPVEVLDDGSALGGEQVRLRFTIAGRSVTAVLSAREDAASGRIELSAEAVVRPAV
jgi:hypothetical protein